ncbi:DinB family protein [Halalkalibacter alkalisediminis]|uniref:DinB family protein n=1 Tax=Halalkalibacter alkalisediminis TaxID=935616 RepID=UPI0023605A77|nr:DinB family protein [Halalkalibacter alkalisediminis]
MVSSCGHQKRGDDPKRKADLQSAESLLEYLHETREQTLAFLESNPIRILEETRSIPEGYRSTPIDHPSVGWIFHRVFDHEVYHLGQVNTLLRLQGITAPKM